MVDSIEVIMIMIMQVGEGMITLHCLIMREHRQGSDNQENPCCTPGDKQGSGLELLHSFPWHQDIANQHNMQASHTGDYI